jgi:hypothetical protein
MKVSGMTISMYNPSVFWHLFADNAMKMNSASETNGRVLGSGNIDINVTIDKSCGLLPGSTSKIRQANIIRICGNWKVTKPAVLNDSKRICMAAKNMVATFLL